MDPRIPGRILRAPCAFYSAAPERFKNNTPARLAETLKPYKATGLFPDFPFGGPFNHEAAFKMPYMGLRSRCDRLEFATAAHRIPGR
jgi:hypothetical protein